MCDVTGAIAAASFVLSAAGSMAQHQQQNQAAKAQNKYMIQNTENANAALRNQYAATTQRITQEQAASSQKIDESSRAAQAAAATTRVAAGESGVSGLSVDALLADVYGQDHRFRDSVKHQEEWTVSQLQREMQGQKFQAQDRINSVRPAMRPSMFGLGMKIGEAGLNSYTSYKEMKASGVYD